MQTTNATPFNQSSRPSTGGLHGPCYIKMLVASGIAGSIIGKSGEEIATIEKNTNCTIRLSSTQSYFPSTYQRICVISGTLESILDAIDIILSKIKQYTQTYGAESNMKVDMFNNDSNVTPEGEDKIMCTLVVPKTAVSSIIGRGGQTIKKTSETSGAKVVVSERENGLLERLVHFFGTYDSVKKAAMIVIKEIQEDPKLKESCQQLDYRNSVLPDASMQVAPVMNYGYPAYSAAESVSYPGIQPQFLHYQCEIHIHMPDSAMGAVIGKQGSCMLEIMRRTGAKILVSQKGVLVPNTMNRQVTISGTLLAVHHAHALLHQQYLMTVGATDDSSQAYSNGNLNSRHNPAAYQQAYTTQGQKTSYGQIRAEDDPNLMGQAYRLTRTRATLYNPYSLNQ